MRPVLLRAYLFKKNIVKDQGTYTTVSLNVQRYFYIIYQFLSTNHRNSRYDVWSRSATQKKHSENCAPEWMLFIGCGKTTTVSLTHHCQPHGVLKQWWKTLFKFDSTFLYHPSSSRIPETTVWVGRSGVKDTASYGPHDRWDVNIVVNLLPKTPQPLRTTSSGNNETNWSAGVAIHPLDWLSVARIIHLLLNCKITINFLRLNADNFDGPTVTS